MKKSLILARALGLVVFTVVAASATAVAATVRLYADTAPNASDVSSFAAWKTAAYAAAAAGTFVNMASGANPGTTNFMAREAIVESGGNLGQRLHWVYWLPGQSVAGLADRFQYKSIVDWDGVAYANGSVEDGPEVGWSPAGGIDYDANGDTIADGVVGTFGIGWAPSPYSEAAIQEQVDGMYAYQTYWQGVVRYRDLIQDPWQTEGLTLNLVPEPASILALASGLLGMTLTRRRRSS